MKKIKLLVIVILSGLCIPALSQQPFTPGNIVVYRVGDGTIPFANGLAFKVYLDEYTPSGTLVQSILMPNTGQNKITMAARSTNYNTGGLLTLSSDGKYLIIPGYDADLGTDVAAGPSPRSIGVVDFNGTLRSVTVIPDLTAKHSLSAASDNGNNLWMIDGSNVEYCHAGDNSTTTIATGISAHAVNITQGQLYVSNGSGSTVLIGTVGTGLPVTAGQTETNLPGYPFDPDSNPYQFAFADLDPNVPGADVLYVADQYAFNEGIHKYSLVNGTWVSNGAVGASLDLYTGLTLKVSANTVTIFATRRGNNSVISLGGQLVSLVDNSGYNGTLTGTPTVLANAAVTSRIGFRGVALVPQPAPFTAGNIVVYRVGDGTIPFANGLAFKVYLDEYTPSGTLVQSILMPNTGQNKITMAARSTNYNTGGLLTLSSDGKYLIIPGYDADLGTDVAAGPSPRSIGVVDFNGTLRSVTVIPDLTAKHSLSAASDNGNNLWMIDGSNVEYCHAGDNSTTTIATGISAHAVNITQGQLYVSNGSGSTVLIGTVGTGLPVTAGQTETNLPGYPFDPDSNPYQFAFADLDPNVPGADVLYVADQYAFNEGIHKYSLVNGTWVSNGAVGASLDLYTGLTLKVSANTVTIFATRRGNNSVISLGGQLVSLVDNSGYNGTLTGTPTVLANAAVTSRIGFRGVAPVALNCPSVNGLQVINATSSQATLTWNPGTTGTKYSYYVDTNPIPTGTGSDTTGTTVTMTGLSNGVTYYAHVRTICSAVSTSEWSTVQFITSCKAPAVSALIVNVSATGLTTIKWRRVFGAGGYEYVISTSSTPPSVAGTMVTDTSVTLNSLNPVTQYYVHVRSICDVNTFSGWITKGFTTGCFMPITVVGLLPNHAMVTWNKISNALKYEYALTNTEAKPLSGTYTTDTFHVMDKLLNGSAHYFHVRSICAAATVSDWSTINFHVAGLNVFPNPVSETLYINLYGTVNSNNLVTILDATGRVVKKIQLTGGSAAVDTGTWDAGIYIVHYNDGQNKYIVKMMKQ